MKNNNSIQLNNPEAKKILDKAIKDKEDRPKLSQERIDKIKMALKLNVK